MKKIYILDAINYLFRSYYAIGPMTNPKGQSTNALYGFIRSVQKVIKEFSPDHLVCVFDGRKGKESRKAIYTEYKAHREEGPLDFYPQIEAAFSFCHMAGIPALQIEQYEADDTMASIARWAEDRGATVYICTSDKDLFQLVDDSTFVLNVHKDNLLIDSEKVKEIFGVTPNQMLDFLAIMGDASDNIPGIEGFGPKTASSLLQKFGTLDELLKHPEQVGGKKGDVLKEQKERALLSRKLATLDLTVHFPKDENFFKLKSPNLDLLKEFYHEMKFSTLLKELESSDETLLEMHEDEKEIEYTLIDSEEKLLQVLKILSKVNPICIDTETTFDHPLLAELVGIGLGFEPKKAWYIPFLGPIDKNKIKELLTPLINEKEFYGQNIKFDLHVLSTHGLLINKVCFDTMVASYLLTPQNRRHNLDELSLERFNKKKIPIESLVGEGRKRISMKEVSLAKISEYCCEDVDYTCRLYQLFNKELKKNDLDEVFFEIEVPLIPVLAKMERHGIFLDTHKITEIASLLQQELQELEQKIYKEVGKEFNLNSPKQLSEILYDHLGLQPSRKKGSANSTAAKILEELAEETPIVSTILEYRGLEKLRSTYTETLISQVNPHTKRIHCTFNQSVAATGRLSCQDPNLQNIPIRSERGRKIREGFKPQKEGWVYLSADYSQIELRLLAHFCKDPELIKAFRSNEDIHAYTASVIYQVPLNEVTKEMRSAAKAVNFGILYGQGPYGLSKVLSISTKQAQKIIETYFARYSHVKEYLDQCIKNVQKTGYAITLTGRKRPIPEITNKNAIIRNAAERLAVNTPLQGTNADIIKKAMIEIDKEIIKNNLEGYMILQIHDELLFEVPTHEIEFFKKMIKEKMEHAVNLIVPLTVNISIGKNWGEC